MTNEQATERQAAHECLMRELVEALETQVSMHRSALVLLRCDDEFIAKQIGSALAVLARAKEQQQ